MFDAAPPRAAAAETPTTGLEAPDPAPARGFDLGSRRHPSAAPRGPAGADTPGGASIEEVRALGAAAGVCGMDPGQVVCGEETVRAAAEDAERAAEAAAAPAARDDDVIVRMMPAGVWGLRRRGRGSRRARGRRGGSSRRRRRRWRRRARTRRDSGLRGRAVRRRMLKSQSCFNL